MRALLLLGVAVDRYFGSLVLVPTYDSELVLCEGFIQQCMLIEDGLTFGRGRFRVHSNCIGTVNDWFAGDV